VLPLAATRAEFVGVTTAVVVGEPIPAFQVVYRDLYGNLSDAARVLSFASAGVPSHTGSIPLMRTTLGVSTATATVFATTGTYTLALAGLTAAQMVGARTLVVQAFAPVLTRAEFVGVTTSILAGEALGNVTVRLFDQRNAPMDAPVQLRFANTDGSSTGTIALIRIAAGTYQILPQHLTVVGQTTLSVLSQSGFLLTTATVMVEPLSDPKPYKAIFFMLPSTLRAGTSFPQIRIEIRDSLDRPTTLWGRVTLKRDKFSLAIPMIVATTPTKGQYTATLSAPLVKSGTYTAQVEDTLHIITILKVEGSFAVSVSPLEASNITIENLQKQKNALLWQDYIKGDTLPPFTAQIRDIYGNLTSYAGSLVLQDSSGQTLTPIATQQISEGYYESQPVVLGQAGWNYIAAPQLQAARRRSFAARSIAMIPQEPTLFIRELLPEDPEPEPVTPEQPSGPVPTIRCVNPRVLTLYAQPPASIDPQTPRTAYKHSLKPGYKLVWSDEFNGSQLDNTKWTPQIGIEPKPDNAGIVRRMFKTDPNDTRNGRRSNIRVAGGSLTIEGRRENYTGTIDSGPWGTFAEQADFTTGWIQTRYKGDWRFALVEARVKVPSRPSGYSAVWMLSTDELYKNPTLDPDPTRAPESGNAQPASGEIDIMESEHGVTFHTMHWLSRSIQTPERQFKFLSTDFGDFFAFNPARQGDDFGGMQSVLPQTEFNTLLLDWRKNAITATVNQQHHFRFNYDTGRRTPTSTPYELSPTNQRIGPWVFNEKFYLILSFSTENPPFNTMNWSEQMEVDYVRVYQQDEGRPITVYGEGFLPFSQIFIDGAPVPTNFVDGQTLSGVIPTHLLPSLGNGMVMVTVRNGGAAVSPSYSVTVNDGTATEPIRPSSLLLYVDDNRTTLGNGEQARLRAQIPNHNLQETVRLVWETQTIENGQAGAWTSVQERTLPLGSPFDSYTLTMATTCAVSAINVRARMLTGGDCGEFTAKAAIFRHSGEAAVAFVTTTATTLVTTITAQAVPLRAALKHTVAGASAVRYQWRAVVNYSAIVNNKPEIYRAFLAPEAITNIQPMDAAFTSATLHLPVAEALPRPANMPTTARLLDIDIQATPLVEFTGCSHLGESGKVTIVPLPTGSQAYQAYSAGQSALGSAVRSPQSVAAATPTSSAETAATQPNTSSEYTLALRIAPNPVADVLAVQFRAPSPGRYTAEVVDALQRRVMLTSVEYYGGGEQRWTFPLAHLPNGSYVLRMYSTQSTQTRPLLTMQPFMILR
jgi:hypothetical protein